jgi:hypothetical protein
MQPLVIFPDVPQWAVGYIRSNLALRAEPYAQNVYVATETPNPRRSRMVIIRRDGGPRLDVVREQARLGVQVWGPETATGDEEVADLTQLVRALFAASPGEGPVRKATETGGPLSPLETSVQPLRFFTVELIVRGTDFV